MFPFDPPETIRKPLVFWCFEGDQKGTLGRKGLNEMMEGEVWKNPYIEEINAFLSHKTLKLQEISYNFLKIYSITILYLTFFFKKIPYLTSVIAVCCRSTKSIRLFRNSENITDIKFSSNNKFI